MNRPDDIMDRLRHGNPVPQTPPLQLADTNWGQAIAAGILHEPGPGPGLGNDQPAPRRRRRAPRRRLYVALSLCVLLVTAGSVVAITGLPGGYQEPREPQAELSRPSDPAAAVAADPSAAERILKAGGWSPEPETLDLAATAAIAGTDYALWTYHGPNGPAALLIGEPDRLGGVHTECSSARITICGMASSSTGYLLVVGTTAPTAQQTTITLSDGDTIDAPTGDGYWFARIPFSETSPQPTVISSHDSSQNPVGELPAERLRQEITTVLAGPPKLG